ncbi:MAG: hypothetical protein WC796_06025 [Candidatus Pacearchaeota archaeon]|jgi:hypothetical protein
MLRIKEYLEWGLYRAFGYIIGGSKFADQMVKDDIASAGNYLRLLKESHRLENLFLPSVFSNEEEAFLRKQFQYKQYDAFSPFYTSCRLEHCKDLRKVHDKVSLFLSN